MQDARSRACRPIRRSAQRVRPAARRSRGAGGGRRAARSAAVRGRPRGARRGAAAARAQYLERLADRARSAGAPRSTPGCSTRRSSTPASPSGARNSRRSKRSSTRVWSRLERAGARRPGRRSTELLPALIETLADLSGRLLELSLVQAGARLEAITLRADRPHRRGSPADRQRLPPRLAERPGVAGRLVAADLLQRQRPAERPRHRLQRRHRQPGRQPVPHSRHDGPAARRRAVRRAAHAARRAQRLSAVAHRVPAGAPQLLPVPRPRVAGPAQHAAADAAQRDQLRAAAGRRAGGHLAGRPHAAAAVASRRRSGVDDAGRAPRTARDLVQSLSDLLNVQNDFLSVWVNYEVQRMAPGVRPGRHGARRRRPAARARRAAGGVHRRRRADSRVPVQRDRPVSRRRPGVRGGAGGRADARRGRRTAASSRSR